MLKNGFDDLGVKADFLSFSEHNYKYSNDNFHYISKPVIYFDGKMLSSNNIVLRTIFLGCSYMCRILIFLWALVRFDVFIYGSGTSFFRFYDLPILKFFKKRIIYIFFGSDSRPPYINGKFFNITTEDTIMETSRKKKNIMIIEKYADVIVDNPPTSHLHERKVVCFGRIGFPVSLGYDVIPESGTDDQVIRILHAPSHVEGKGTEQIRTAIKNLQNKGYAIEYVEIVNKPNSFVLKQLSYCDFIVDELYSDAIMAGFATEAAFFGKPAIVGGYATIGDMGNLPDECIPPVHHCHPDHVEQAIEKLIIDKSYRVDLGLRAKQFLDRCWSARSVAERYLRLIKGDYPDDWLYDPKDIRYLHGWGMNEKCLKENIRAILSKGGREAFQLSDKPVLEQMYLDFAIIK
ncbi:MAG: hypothetical protein NCA08_08680 [Deltaproteobacteria bacterium]|nr:hypothetical protein [Candidatus Deferrimicrobium borealis]